MNDHALLLEHLHEILTEPNEIVGDAICLTEAEVTIRPEINRLDKDAPGMAVVYFYIDAPLLDETFFECATGMGKTPEEALMQAEMNFMLCAMCGLRHFLAREYAYEESTDFFGEQKRWHVSESCIVRMGRDPGWESGGFWETIREGLLRRLGNRRVYWVKCYAAKQMDGEVIGEVRINDIVSRELSALAAEKAKRWETEGNFYSEKQFFFLTQDEETFTAYPYSMAEIGEAAGKALRLFEAIDSDEAFERYFDDLAGLLGDESLAAELHSFLPEMCAENAFPDADYDEAVTICRGGGLEDWKVYKTQFSSYFWIERRLFSGFESGEFSAGLYRSLVGASAIYSVIEKMQKERGEESPMKGARISTIMNMPKGYRVR